MTSQVNPFNIDGTYPIAGQDNDSQGFRDNFTNTANNFAFVKDEIEDLQARAVLKSALTNSTLDNSMAYAKLVDAQLQSYSEAFYSATAGTYAVDYKRGNAQQIETTQSGAITFTGWPAAGQLGRIVLRVTVSNVAHKLTLPAACVLGSIATLPGINGLTVTYPEASDYFYEFLTTDGGVNIFVHELGERQTTAAIADLVSELAALRARVTALENQ